MSYREFSRRHYVDDLAESLRHCGLDPQTLELELREAGLNSNHHLGLEVLSQLRDLGVQRSVDAFGDMIAERDDHAVLFRFGQELAGQ